MVIKTPNINAVLLASPEFSHKKKYSSINITAGLQAHRLSDGSTDKKRSLNFETWNKKKLKNSYLTPPVENDWM